MILFIYLVSIVDQSAHFKSAYVFDHILTFQLFFYYIEISNIFMEFPIKYFNDVALIGAVQNKNAEIIRLLLKAFKIQNIYIILKFFFKLFLNTK